MPAISLLTNEVKRFLRLRPGAKGNNSLATFAAVNSVLEDAFSKSNLATYSTGALMVTQVAGVVTSSQNVVRCADKQSGCWSCLNSCAYHDVKATTSFAKTATGTFLLTVNIADDPDYTKIQVKVGNLTQPGYVATVNQLTPTTFEIKTFDILAASLGNAIDNVFDDTLIEVTYYYSPFTTV